MEPPSGRDERRQGRARRFPSMRPPTPRMCAASTTGYRSIDGVARTRQPRPTRRCAGGGQLALGGRAVLHPHRQAAARHPDRGAPPLQALTGRSASDRRGSPPRGEPARDPARPDDGDSASGPPGAPHRVARPERDRARHASSPTRAVRGRRPYEVLLRSALVGDAAHFTRQDGVEEAWRVMHAADRRPPPVHPYEPGTWGPGRPSPRRRIPGLARAVAREAARSDRAAPEPSTSASRGLGQLENGLRQAGDWYTGART